MDIFSEKPNIEKYLFDKKVLKAYCSKNGLEFKEVEYNKLVTDTY